MPTPVIHERTEPLRELIAQFDKAPTLVKIAYAREFFDQSLTLLAELCHERDRLEQRVATLERFPELRTAPPHA
jgi:hypothetical protein